MTTNPSHFLTETFKVDVTCTLSLKLYIHQDQPRKTQENIEFGQKEMLN